MDDPRRAAPRVSVVLPVYNGLPYLSEAESILGQTFTDWELVAVDDGSRDGSLETLSGFAATRDRIRVVINETNLGVAVALNRGWGDGRGQYIAIANADDVSLPDRLSKQVRFLDANPAVAVVGSSMIIVDPEGHTIATQRFPTGSRAIRSALRRHNRFAHPSVMIRRSSLELVGGYRFTYVEDYDLWLRLAERFDLANLHEPLIRYRLHAGQITSQSRDEMVRRTFAVRLAADARRHARPDPLTGIHELTPAVLDGLGASEAELAAAISLESLLWATLLAALGRHTEADEFVVQASRTLGAKARRAFEASCELAEAQKMREAGRPFASLAHVLLALYREPRYASSRLSEWLRDRLGGTGLLRWL